ncbi:hypothetical protein DRH14_03080, partial [Candidatus Shapirobacteria bacterium]
MIIPQKLPQQILEEHLDEEEIEAMAQHLFAYQKSGGQWKEYRHKIASDLLTTWGKAIKECQVNGFLLPQGYKWNGKWKIQFNQTLKQSVNDETLEVGKA